jgi:hypothetical protein
MVGPGEDVRFSFAFFLPILTFCPMQAEVTINDEPPQADKKGRDLEKGDDETGHLVRVGVMGLHLGKRHTARATSADDSTTRPVTADTLVAHEERNKFWSEKNAGMHCALP